MNDHHDDKHRHRHRHHHHHSGSTPWDACEGPYNDYSSTTVHNHAATQDAAQTCLRALRGVADKDEREHVIGAVLSSLLHSRHIDGLVRLFELSGHATNHYRHGVEDRAY